MDNTGNGVRVNLINSVITLADPAPGITKAAHYVLSSTPTSAQIGIYNDSGYLTFKYGSNFVGSKLRCKRDFVFTI